MRPRRITDPVERLLAELLDEMDVCYVHESEDNEITRRLDFYVPRYDLYIEVKAFHAARIAEQMSRAERVIAIQNRAAVMALADMVRLALGR